MVATPLIEYNTVYSAVAALVGCWGKCRRSMPRAIVMLLATLVIT